MADGGGARAYFDEIAEVVSAARDRAGTVERCYDVGAGLVRLRFAGDALVPRLTAALEHLAAAGGGAVLTVDLFDSASSGTTLPFPSASVRQAFDAGEVWIYRDDSRRILFEPAFRTLTMLDAERRRAFFWTDDARRLSYHETSFPLRSLWHWWLRRQGMQLAHAAAVANGRGAAVVAGPSGAGKSTTALACLSSPLQYLGDDFVILRNGPDPVVRSLYCSAKLHRNHARRFDLPDGAITNADRADEEKALLFVNRCAPERIRIEAPVAAVLFPQVEPAGTTRVEPLAPGEALRMLAVSTIFLLHDADASDFAHLAAILRARPCFRLVLGSEIARIPVVVGELLESVIGDQ